jgi:hypothetical protein
MKCLFEFVECEHRNTGGCSRGDCVFAPQDNAESPSHSLQQLNVAIALLNDMVKVWDVHGVIHKDSWYYERANAVIAQQATV